MDDDRELLRAVHDRYADMLMRYALRHTRDQQLAEDVVQETLLRAWQHPTRLQADDDAVRAWLFTVARNLLVDEARSPRNRTRSIDGLPEASTSDRIDTALDRIAIADALASLSVDHRAVIVDAYYLGRSVRQTAEHLGIPEGTVKSRLHYGVRALRNALQERGVTR